MQLEISKKTWRYHNPVEVIFSEDYRSKVKELTWGAQSALLVTSKSFSKRHIAKEIVDSIKPVRCHLYDEVTPNPTVSQLDSVAFCMREMRPDYIIALGGGSVIDTAKVLSLLLGCHESITTMELIQKGSHQADEHIPVIAIPTTSGTGAEVTPFATVWDDVGKQKHSVTGPGVVPQTALLCPRLTLSLPAPTTLYSALDALSHAFESIWNRNSTPITEAYSIAAIEILIRDLPTLILEPADITKRSTVQVASNLAGLAISQTRTAIAHSISYPLTSYFDVPHGLACSFTLPTLLKLFMENAEIPGEKRMLFIEACRVLTVLELPQRLAEYASSEEILGLCEEMAGNDRAGNFLIESFDLESLVAESLIP